MSLIDLKRRGERFLIITPRLVEATTLKNVTKEQKKAKNLERNKNAIVSKKISKMMAVLNKTKGTLGQHNRNQLFGRLKKNKEESQKEQQFADLNMELERALAEDAANQHQRQQERANREERKEIAADTQPTEPPKAVEKKKKNKVVSDYALRPRGDMRIRFLPKSKRGKKT